MPDANDICSKTSCVARVGRGRATSLKTMIRATQGFAVGTTARTAPLHVVTQARAVGRGQLGRRSPDRGATISKPPLRPFICHAGEGEGEVEEFPPAVSRSDEEASAAVSRSDDVLPDSLTDAIHESAKATVDAMNSGFSKCVVEILLPDFWDPNSGPVYSEEGDQLRFWKMTRRFIDDIVSNSAESAKVKAIYPDAGVAAMLRNQWTDATFSVASLNDRKPVDPEDELVVMAAPDPPSLDDIVKISNALLPTQTLVMFNPRLASGDVGVGLAMRRLRERFMGEFMTTYSLRPIGDIGSVFKRFPSNWQVFIADNDMPGRYVLAAERPSRPGGEELDLIVMNALGGANGEGGEGGEGGEELGLGDKVSLFARQMQRFMKSLTN